MFSRAKRSSKKLGGHSAWSGKDKTPLKRARTRGTPRKPFTPGTPRAGTPRTGGGGGGEGGEGGGGGGTFQKTSSQVSTPFTPSTPFASSSAPVLPKNLRSVSKYLPSLLHTRLLAARNNVPAGKISRSGKWRVVVCDGSLFIWAILDPDANSPPPLVAAGIDLPDNQSVDLHQLNRVCILENDWVGGKAAGNRHRARQMSPTVVYVTPWGEIQCWQAIGTADGMEVKGQISDLSDGEICMSVLSASESACLCMTSFGRVVGITTDWHASTLSLRTLYAPEPGTSQDPATSTPSVTGFLQGWFGGGASANTATPTTTSRHPGAIAAKNVLDNAVECCVARSRGPEWPGEMTLELFQVNGLTCAEIESSRVTISLKTPLDAGSIDTIAVAFAEEVDAIVLLVACDVPSSFYLLQVGNPRTQRYDKSAALVPRRVVELTSIQPGASCFQLLLCGPVTNRNGTSPAECMAYVSFNQHPGAGWGLVRSRLSRKEASFEDSERSNQMDFDIVVSSGASKKGRILGGGVSQRRPHFLSTIPGAAVFTASQSQLLQVFSTREANATYTPKSIRTDPIPVRRAGLGIFATRGGSSVGDSDDAVRACAKEAHALVESLMSDGHQQIMESFCEKFDATTVESGVNLLSGHVLDQGPRLSHSFVSIDRGTRGGPISRHKVAHKLIGQRLSDKKMWLTTLCRVIDADARSELDDFRGVKEILCQRRAQLDATISLYNFEQHQSSSNTIQTRATSSSFNIVSDARKEVVQGLRRFTPAALSSEGLSVADAFYGAVTKVTEILPEICGVLLSGPRDPVSTVFAIQACLAVVNPLLDNSISDDRLSLSKSISRSAMLEASEQQALHKLLKHAVGMVQSAPDNAVGSVQATQAVKIMDDLKRGASRLVALLLGDIRASLLETKGDHTQQMLDGVNSLYSDTFSHIVLALLEVGMIDDVKHIAEDHVHFETLFMVCRQTEITRGAAPAQQLMQSYLGTDRIRRDERERRNFPHYVYSQYHKSGEAYRILCEPDARNNDVRKYLEDTQSLAWMHALRERRYSEASDLTKKVAFVKGQKLACQKTLVSISKLLAKAHSTDAEQEEKKSTLGDMKRQENINLADSHLTLISIQNNLSIDAVINKTTADKLRSQTPLTPDELVECLLDRVNQLNFDDDNKWAKVESASQSSLIEGVELARQLISSLWEELRVSADIRASTLDMSCPEFQYDEELIMRLQRIYGQLWEDARPHRTVRAVTEALVVAAEAFKAGYYGEAERHDACVKVWAACIGVDSTVLIKANQLRMQGSDKAAEAALRQGSVTMESLKSAQAMGVMLEGTILQDAIALSPIRNESISSQELSRTVESCWQMVRN